MAPWPGIPGAIRVQTRACSRKAVIRGRRLPGWLAEDLRFDLDRRASSEARSGLLLEDTATGVASSGRVAGHLGRSDSLETRPHPRSPRDPRDLWTPESRPP